MKVFELLNESGSGLYAKAIAAMAKAEKELVGSKGKESSHNIGGNFNAVVSGEVRIRKNFVAHGSYNSSIQWDQILEIGNNLQGKKALDEAKRLYDEMVEMAKTAGADIKEHDKSVAHIDLDGEKFTVKYEYARSFCWVGIRKAG